MKAAIGRRIRDLEAAFAPALIPDYPPLTSSEIADIERRARAGETITRVELACVERQTPIIDGELMMTCYGGRLFLKRYIGVEPEFKTPYLQARVDVVLQANARIQQNCGVAASVLFKVMTDPATPASVRARTAQGILECANKSIEMESFEVRLAALEAAAANGKQQ